MSNEYVETQNNDASTERRTRWWRSLRIIGTWTGFLPTFILTTSRGMEYLDEISIEDDTPHDWEYEISEVGGRKRRIFRGRR